MIPQAQADLADAIIAECGHVYTRDQAIAMAGRMIAYLERKGHEVISN